MSSLIDNIRGKGGTAAPTQPPGFQAPGIAKKLEAARAALAELEADHGNAALADVLGEAGAADRLRKLTADIATARSEVTKLEAAHAAAVARDEAAVRAHRAQLQKSQLNALRQHLASRDKAAERFASAITEASAAYHELLDRSAKAAATAEAARFDFSGAECEHDPLIRLVQCEMHRVSAEPGDLGGQGKALPGSQLPGMEYQHRPSELPPLVDRLKQASTNALARLTGNLN